jgi:protein transport protein SEC9
MEKHHQDREVRDATRKAAWDSSARNEGVNRSLQGMNGTGKKSTLADRAQFQFEPDSEDDEMENEIDSNLGKCPTPVVEVGVLTCVILDALHGAAKRLNLLGRAMGTEVDEQNKHIANITGKTDKVDDQIAMNRARLDRIR